ncbi:hypothetical protein [Flagellimonas aequoris]|uniref:Uncharacterized protein n=1 Tax=Flagellimonas aequoris TaxID=2306997 RepID=A0A418N5H4_9FLAO|nr:hypothetical protein [Allomuricauda aequoris]RIV68943.1 hypothetical protein D2U88_17430 [Allomuricauda aequoris]TXK00652.1 hypothetical protein FQ019_17225 [Allomuricauda aequoris]
MNEVNQFLDNLSTGLEGRDFWVPYRDFCQNIEKVEITKLIDSLPILLSKIENDFMASEFYQGIDNACSKDLKFGKSLYESVSINSNEKIQGVLARVVSGVFKKDYKWATKEVLKLFDEATSIKKAQGIASIYYMDLSEPKLESFNIEVDGRFSELIEDENTSVRVLAGVVSSCGNQRKHIPNADAHIRALLCKEENEIKVQLLHILDHQIDIESEKDFYSLILDALVSMDIKLTGAYNSLAYLLQLKVKDNLSLVTKFLNAWVGFRTENANNTKLLQTVFDEIHNLKPKYFQTLVTEWLNDDSINYQLAIFGILRELSYRNVYTLELDKKLLKDYSLYDIEYVTRKIIGFVYEKELSTSLLFSIIEAKHDDKPTVNFMSDIFVNHLIFNYYSTIDFLNEKKKSAPTKLKKIINQIIKDGEKYYDAYSKLETLKEFNPSEVRLNYMNRLQSKKFSKSYDDSEKSGGSFSSLFTTLHFRSGKTSFAKFKGEYSAHMEPKLISHSTEMPRGEYIDPVSQAQLRLESQGFKRRK